MLGLLLSFISTYALVVPQIQSILIPSPPRIAVSITFDDGPHVLYTSEILDILKEKKVQATFFVIGNRIQGKEYLLKRSSRE